MYAKTVQGVLLPYKITLLSNRLANAEFAALVLLPYKITLLSNMYGRFSDGLTVLLPYKITLLSNLKFEKATLLAV